MWREHVVYRRDWLLYERAQRLNERDPVPNERPPRTMQSQLPKRKTAKAQSQTKPKRNKTTNLLNDWWFFRY